LLLLPPLLLRPLLPLLPLLRRPPPPPLSRCTAQAARRWVGAKWLIAAACLLIGDALLRNAAVKTNAADQPLSSRQLSLFSPSSVVRSVV